MTEVQKIETSLFDVADYLGSPEDAAAYLSAVLEDGDAAEFKVALGAIARSRGMRGVAETAGLGRESLYKALSSAGNPTFDTVLRVMAALDMRLSATLAPKPQPDPA